MAEFKLNSFLDIGTQGYHDATSWRVTLDQAGDQIIDESIEDHVNLTTWRSPLPDGNGGFYGDLDRVYLWVRVHILGTASPWTMVGWGNQNDQSFTITQNNQIVEVVNSIVAGIQ